MTKAATTMEPYRMESYTETLTFIMTQLQDATTCVVYRLLGHVNVSNPFLYYLCWNIQNLLISYAST